MRSHLLACSAASALLCVASSASAQVTGFAVNRFEPAETGSQFFVIDNLDLRGSGRPALGAVLDYGYKPLVVYDLDGNERSALVRHQTFVHLGVSMVLWDRFRLGINAPVAIYQDGEPTTLNGVAYKPAEAAAMGDVRLAADLRLAGEKTDPFTLALGVRAWVPTGTRQEFAGDGRMRIGPQLLAAGDLGVFTYGVRVGGVYRDPTVESFAGSSVKSELVGAAGFGFKTADSRFVIGPEVFASSPFDSDAFFKTRGTPVEWIVGAHWDAVPGLRLGAGGGSGLTRGYGSPVARALFTLEWAPPYEKPDRDGDGIADDEDACPSVAGVPDRDPSKNGCPPAAPPPPPDRDQDGLLDSEDACPDLPGPRTTNPKTTGCPDMDQDGIPDPQDACREEPGIATDDPKTNGCPPDKDGDGIFDPQDACPEVKGVANADPKKNGCPLDGDGDGILDVDDACPAEPGPKNADPKKNGCPLVIVTDKAIQITEQVKFKFNSAELLKESDGILEAVRGVLEAHPEIVKLRVEGHTDNVGNAAYNKQLSTKRAASVTKWLTDHKIEKSRLISQGFGMEQPIDVNTTTEGRANNRRVAFTIVEKDDTKKAAPAAPAPKP
jgi:outer membrane protein OmpA-like peptidoglycan-associated protein